MRAGTRSQDASPALGHVAIGLEGAPRFAEMARAFSGCEVWQQDFLRLDLPAGRFDGIFANASLFHVPSSELPRVLRELQRGAEAARRAVLVESARERRRGLESRALRRLSFARRVARLRRRRRLRGDRALLPSRGTAARAAAVARDRLAESVSPESPLVRGYGERNRSPHSIVRLNLRFEESPKA